uniref:(California timema) hypothetical protein n=1 Tax=Timema californicum TaxID=61474 RepID=A0A7R9JGD6_TIMCA|nr:unnamed protein product [Timema californicum]
MSLETGVIYTLTDALSGLHKTRNMKTSYVAIILGFAALVSGASLQNSTAEDGEIEVRISVGGIQPRLKLNLNSALDTVFTNIRKNTTGFDPFSLPDVEKSFNWLVIKGDLDLTHGQLWGLSTIARTGDATADLEGSEADVVVKLAFDDFKLQYDFSATIDDLGPSGLAHGEITEFYINAEVLANLSDTTAVKISLKDLAFEHAGIEVSAARHVHNLHMRGSCHSNRCTLPDFSTVTEYA